MRSIAVALTWEFWRRSRWWIFAEIVVMVCVTMVLYGRIQSLGAKTHAKIHYMVLFFQFGGFAWMIFFSQFDKKNNRLGFPAHLYIKPIQTWVLVWRQMLLSMVTIVLLYLFSAGCARILLGITWPLFGPMLLLATALACTQAIIWSMVGFLILRAVTCLMVLVALQLWQFSRYGSIWGFPDISNLNKMWIDLTFGELLTMVLCLGAAYIVAVIGVSRDRRGDCVGWPGFWEWFGHLFDLLPGRHKPFKSPAAAQFWYEWRDKDWGMPTLSGIFVVPIILAGIFGPDSTNDILRLFFGLGLFITPLAVSFLFRKTSYEKAVSALGVIILLPAILAIIATYPESQA